ncbi:hypothetical protein EYC84_006304 [Monilinia fructicola]|uniref:Uncharacterized protein n=1 Tax=Monilinia fructicola TaxID=38448 RepID=A0A5M9K6Q3_MONFR|nr:hypothetical protein EYC84_006304 [Monilinia fructicola]
MTSYRITHLFSILKRTTQTINNLQFLPRHTLVPRHRYQITNAIFTVEDRRKYKQIVTENQKLQGTDAQENCCATGNLSEGME